MFTSCFPSKRTGVGGLGGWGVGGLGGWGGPAVERKSGTCVDLRINLARALKLLLC